MGDGKPLIVRRRGIPRGDVDGTASVNGHRSARPLGPSILRDPAFRKLVNAHVEDVLQGKADIVGTIKRERRRRRRTRRQGDVEARVRRVLSRTNRWTDSPWDWRFNDIVRAARARRSAVRRVLVRLVRRGAVVQDGNRGCHGFTYRMAR